MWKTEGTLSLYVLHAVSLFLCLCLLIFGKLSAPSVSRCCMQFHLFLYIVIDLRKTGTLSLYVLHAFSLIFGDFYYYLEDWGTLSFYVLHAFSSVFMDSYWYLKDWGYPQVVCFACHFIVFVLICIDLWKTEGTLSFLVLHAFSCFVLICIDIWKTDVCMFCTPFHCLCVYFYWSLESWAYPQFLGFASLFICFCGFVWIFGKLRVPSVSRLCMPFHLLLFIFIDIWKTEGTLSLLVLHAFSLFLCWL